jgi:hypothetical protein
MRPVQLIKKLIEVLSINREGIDGVGFSKLELKTLEGFFQKRASRVYCKTDFMCN